MKVENQKVVGIEYTLKNHAGEVIDSNEGEDILHFIQGIGNIVPGLEKAMHGKAAGDRFEVLVKAAEGYGVYDEKLVRRVPREKLKGLANVFGQGGVHGSLRLCFSRQSVGRKSG